MIKAPVLSLLLVSSCGLLVSACGGRAISMEIGDEDSRGGRGSSNDGRGQGNGGTSTNEDGRLSISPETLADAQVDAPYEVTFSAWGGVGAGYSFRLASGSLPRGLSLSEEGTLSGIPRVRGEFAFDVEVVDPAGGKGRASFRLRVRGHRWVAFRTSGNSGGDTLFLFDRAKPHSAVLDLGERHLLQSHVQSVPGAHDTFSPDGRWLITYAVSGGSFDFFASEMTGEELGESKFLFRSEGQYGPCAWAPDSSKLACVQRSKAGGAIETSLIAFDMSAEQPGPKQSLKQLMDGGHWLDQAHWLDRNSLVFPSADDDISLIRWVGGSPGGAESVSAPAGALVRLSRDRRRGLITGLQDWQGVHASPVEPAQFEVVDFASRQRVTLERNYYWSFSDSLEAAIAYESEQAGDPRLYYRIAEDRVIGPVGSATVERLGSPWSRDWQRTQGEQWSGRHLAEIRDGRAVIVTIDEDAVVVQPVPGDVEDVTTVRFSPDGRWLYMGSGEGAQPTNHWLSRVVDGSPQPAVLIVGGRPLEDVRFSPHSERLLLHGYLSYAERAQGPVSFRLYDLTDPEDIKERVLDLPLYWADAEWAPDSSGISFIGASSDDVRRLYVVDVLADDQPPWLVAACPSDPLARVTGCVGVVRFQP